MPDFMRKQVRFSSLENANPNLAKALFEKTIKTLKHVLQLCCTDGRIRKIKKRLEPEESIDVPVKTRKEKRRTLKQKKEELPEQNDVKMEQATKEKGKITEKYNE